MEKIIRRQTAVPLTQDEINRLDNYSEKTGMKKGAILRFALIEYLDRQEYSDG